MRNKLKPLILFALIIITAISCEEEKTEIDPAKAILGKWQYLGHELESEGEIDTTVYIEYLTDSVLRIYDYKEDRFTSYRKYWIDDSLLYKTGSIESNDVNRYYKYEFSNNNNILILEVQGILADFFVSYYERIE